MEQGFDTYAAYRTALLEAIARGAREILLFDPDLAETGLEAPAGAEALAAFLTRAGGGECVKLLVADAGHLEGRCPRLQLLLERHAHRITLRIAEDAAQSPSAYPPFAVIDRHDLIIRFHHERPRGKICVDDPGACAPRIAQFETMWINSRPGQTRAPLGL
ncbi:hypothetical protein E6C76_09350 [Pseudothauera nasutitermitis]|uniref:DUF7931 domain-containing protein n=1 Tax=Pseudothauera nasutitermitis TaxID=2565930 RepID=A0A4S4B078_9RHOO|nr:hypothetical protein [Pseudothauera nasutitermitis]THF65746.1 hypothetical protein E6C76_09350 [Pseudothauera nasutitermitis]